MRAFRAHFKAVVGRTLAECAVRLLTDTPPSTVFFATLIADILLAVARFIGDTGSFRKSDGARQTDAAIRGGLATSHAAFDDFQHFVASIVTEFMGAG